MYVSDLNVQLGPVGMQTFCLRCISSSLLRTEHFSTMNQLRVREIVQVMVFDLPQVSSFPRKTGDPKGLDRSANSRVAALRYPPATKTKEAGPCTCGPASFVCE